MTRIVCGVDVSCATLAASMGRDGVPASFANNPEGIAALGTFCQAHEVDLVAMEATGGYERQPFALLSDQGVGVAILNPRSVRQFAAGMGKLEKTDAIDASMIARFAEVKRAEPLCLPPASQRQLRSLVTRLRQLTEIRTAQRNQRRLLADERIRRSFDELFKLIARQIDEFAGEIAALLSAEPVWSALDSAFRTIEGVADRTVARLMAELPEIDTFSNKANSKLSGLAPPAQDSGKHRGKRSVRGGRSSVREILFIVASVVRRYEPNFMAFPARA